MIKLSVILFICLKSAYMTLYDIVIVLYIITMRIYVRGVWLYVANRGANLSIYYPKPPRFLCVIMDKIANEKLKFKFE